jgi:preprotein translocase subunit YajC
MIGCWIDIVLYIAIGLTVVCFLLIWRKQKKQLEALKKDR